MMINEKMKIHNLSIVGGLIGLGITGLSILRWFILWYDPSQAILGAGIGIIVILGAYLYNWMKMNEEQFEKINKRLDAFTEWWTKQEMQ